MGAGDHQRRPCLGRAAPVTGIDPDDPASLHDRRGVPAHRVLGDQSAELGPAGLTPGPVLLLPWIWSKGAGADDASQDGSSSSGAEAHIGSADRSTSSVTITPPQNSQD